jgi:Cu(I)/Ag(I) efflux system membrane fusion protein
MMSSSRAARRAVQVLLVRLRFPIVLVAVLLLVGYWPVLRNHWDRLTRSAARVEGAISSDTEYWCPMCPGVLSDWPGKCPVCNMALVRRKKGEAVPLPDGVLARMQFSPQRIQLAGIRTQTVEYRPLRREVVLVGLVERQDSMVSVKAEVFATDLPYLENGQLVTANTDLYPGHLPFVGQVRKIEGERAPGKEQVNVWLALEDLEQELPSGTLVTARTESPVMRLAWWRRSAAAAWRDRTAVDLTAHALLTPAGPALPGGIASLLRGAADHAQLVEGQGLALPQSAVIDHGSRKVAFVETGPGMFDAVEVALGPRCGDYYPLLRGIEAGQRVAATGAFLLDAEMWLNHGLAATYFGASRSPSTAPESVAAPAPVDGRFTAEERALIARQKVCPVTGEPLDSMGGPVRVDVAGRTVFICCKGCEKALRREPEKYLPKLAR